jgi:hypothetical protein
LGNFVQDWPTKELAKSRLKNWRAYCKRQGYNGMDFGMATGSPPTISTDEEVDEGEEDEGREDDSGTEDSKCGSNKDYDC